jgi:hypothetical protein
LKLETPPSVTPRTMPDAVRTVGAAAGTATLAALLGAACAKAHCTLIVKRHNPRMGAFAVIFAVPLWWPLARAGVR